ncbi:la-related protein 1B-like [Zingiber officinale]|uniref:la-related protein 1B-like n=1 Tax=Zingiber officinale TaxID=94328 RepID=UPI001C4CA3DC|nr:la-related protein 1B-like [Zingiber officinale]
MDEVPSSPSSLPQAAAISLPEPSNRSPQKTPPEDVSPESSDAARGKKHAWKRPSNGSTEAGADVIGGAASWPALSESAKASPKSSSSDALKSLSIAPPSSPTSPAISTSSPKPNSNPSLSRNHSMPSRQKSFKRGNGSGNSSGGAAAGGGIVPSSLPPSSSSPTANSEKLASQQVSPQDQIVKKPTNWHRSYTTGRSGSQTYDGGDHRSYGGHRRWNNGGGASSYHNYGNHRDGERGGQDGYRRNPGGREVRMQPRNAQPYLRPATTVAPPFLSPPQDGPYGTPIVFPDGPSPVFYIATQPPHGALPFVTHPALPPHMFIPAIDPQRANLLKQIDYYFSAENLCRDVFLRQNMDQQGWVPISLIAGFNRVKKLTNSVEFILDTLQLSTVVEMQGDKIRKRHDWMNWILPPSESQFGNADSQSSALPNIDNLAARYQNSMRISNRSEILFSRSASGNLNNQILVTANHNWDENGQVLPLTDSDQIASGRSLLRNDTF